MSKLYRLAFGLMLAALPCIASATLNWDLSKEPFSSHPNVRGVGNGSTEGERINAVVAARAAYRFDVGNMYVPPNGTVINITYQDGSKERFINLSASHNGLLPDPGSFQPPPGSGDGGELDFPGLPGSGWGTGETCITDANGWACTEVGGAESCTYIPADTICFGN